MAPREAGLTAATGGPAPAEAVRIEALGKSYGQRRVLRDLHLSLRAGEFVAIVGRSGCGKSTLLRLVAGLESPDAGRVLIGGSDGPEARSGTRIMFQDARLLPWKSVLDNVVLGKPGPEARGQGLALLRRVGLEDRAADWPGVLSGGQRQRVALARALLHSPALLLLDEPLGALDALTRIEMQRLLESIWQEQYFTALLVTHDVAEAITLADRVILLEEGAIALDLPIDLPRPRHFDSAFADLEERILSRLLAPQGE